MTYIQLIQLALSYWKQIACVGASLFLLAFSYNAGSKACEAKHQAALMQAEIKVKQQIEVNNAKTNKTAMQYASESDLIDAYLDGLSEADGSVQDVATNTATARKCDDRERSNLYAIIKADGKKLKKCPLDLHYSYQVLKQDREFINGRK